MPTRWTHITINCSDIDASVDFYTSLCGLSIVRDRRLEGRHNVWLGPATPSGEDPVFVLVIVQDEVRARLDHFGFQCDSREEVDRIADQARRLNILVEPPTDVGGSGWSYRGIHPRSAAKGLVASMSETAPQIIVIAGPNGAGKTTLAPFL